MNDDFEVITDVVQIKKLHRQLGRRLAEQLPIHANVLAQLTADGFINVVTYAKTGDTYTFTGL